MLFDTNFTCCKIFHTFISVISLTGRKSYLAMKKRKFIAVISLLACILTAVACSGNKQEKSAEKGTPSVVEVKIEGMTCTGCEQTIQRNVGKLEGIKSITATFTDGRAVIEYYPAVVDSFKIRDAITGSGYTVMKIQKSAPEVLNN